MNIFIINGGQIFKHSGGKFNNSVTQWTQMVLDKHQVDYRITNINEPYNAFTEVENFKWADIIIYHLPIWWFQVPHALKLYIDEVFSAGHQNGMYASDGRSRQNPAINYGRGGLMQDKRYMVTTSWNAPDTAFTLAGEFFDERSVDDGILFGFHKMNQFTGMEQITGFHFHDIEKNATHERITHYHKGYMEHLTKVISNEVVQV